jgi:hypothetical protein
VKVLRPNRLTQNDLRESPRMLRWVTLSRRHVVLRALYHSEHLRLLRLM